jgi:DNA-binding transcriptional LysR family regulator
MDWDDRRLSRHLKLRDLAVLLEVVRCGSMGKAALRLSVSQPAISKAIADMESALGVRLLDRGPQGVEPTVYARTLLDRGVVVFDELRQAVKQIEFLADPTSGELTIGTSVVLAEGFVARVVTLLSKRYPRIVFHLSANESGAVYHALAQRTIDLAVARLFAPFDEEHLAAEILFDDRHVVAAGASNPWVRRRGVTLAHLLDGPWVLPPLDSLTGTIVVEAFRANGLAVPRATIVTSSTPARHSLIASGRFLTVLPAFVLSRRAKEAAPRALPIDLPNVSRPIALITWKNRTPSPVAQLFIDCARDMARSLAAAKTAPGSSPGP